MNYDHAVPKLVVSQHIIDKMIAAASQYLADETGEAMVGVIVPGQAPGDVSTIYVLDTISPDVNAPDMDTVRERYQFQQGGEHQYEVFTWLHLNWEQHRKKRQNSYGKAHAAKWDMPLLHLGDWHKHPGYMNEPSHGDLLSALDQMDDPENNMKFLLAPIVTIRQDSTVNTTGAQVNFLTVPMEQGLSLRVDWHYIHRDMPDFVPINPVIHPDDKLPGLSHYPWHLKDTFRANEEFARFHQDNIFHSIVLADIDGQAPLEICISTARLGNSKMILLATTWDYPAKPPIARIMPYKRLQEGQMIVDVFDQWWAEAQPVNDPEGWQWSEDKMLSDYLAAIEDALGLRPPPVVKVEESEEDVQPSGNTNVKVEKPTQD